MKIIIIGCGKIGLRLVGTLSGEDHDVTVIDTNKKVIEEITNRFDVYGFCGNGASAAVLGEVGIGGADLLIATTGNDELNMLCCLIARKIGKCYTIARIHNPEYNRELHIIKDEFGFAMTVNSEYMAAVETARILKFPSAQEIESFAKGKVEIIKYKVPEDSTLSDTKVRQIPGKYGVQVLICAVERGDDVIIPNGEFVIKSGDVVSVVATVNMATELFTRMGLAKKKIAKCMIVGGGGVSYYLADMLLKMGMRITIIEKSYERCMFLSENLEGAIVINADAVDPTVLEEEGLREMDAFITMSNIDETNILLSLYAKKNSSAKLITKVHRIAYDDIIKSLDLDTIICPKNIVADNILQYVRAMENASGSNVETLYKIIENKAEALEFVVREGSPVSDIPLMDLKIKPNIIIACINHANKVIIPNGMSKIVANDRVVIVTTNSSLNDISDILEK